jgi:hypothetical protein
VRCPFGAGARQGCVRSATLTGAGYDPGPEDDTSGGETQASEAASQRGQSRRYRSSASTSSQREWTAYKRARAGPGYFGLLQVDPSDEDAEAAGIVIFSGLLRRGQFIELEDQTQRPSAVDFELRVEEIARPTRKELASVDHQT